MNLLSKRLRKLGAITILSCLQEILRTSIMVNTPQFLMMVTNRLLEYLPCRVNHIMWNQMQQKLW